MSVYNTDFALVKRAIDSVLKQDLQDFEFIIMDDGSDDEYKIELENYVNLFQNKIIYRYHLNRGQSRSINEAVVISKGAYIAIIDADDEYKANHLSACLKEMANADLIASTTETVVDKEEDYFVPDKKDPNHSIHVDDCILFATLFGKKEIFETIQFESRYAADALFYELAAKQFKVKKLNLRTYIYYRNIPNSISANLKRQSLN
jgi:glycosyltransferase involved in cell wall biosynthesis